MPDGLPWRFASASIVGTSHKGAETPCQDAHRVALLDSMGGEPALVIAVSDGAGSAKAGEHGARIAVEAICELAEAWFGTGRSVAELDRPAFAEWLSGVREQIAERAAEAESDMRDFACTLLIAVVGTTHAAFCQIGDGAIVVRTEEHEWSWVFWPQHGPYANTTYFVTDDTALDRFECDAGPRRVNEIGAFSDGLEQLVLDHRQQAVHDPFFERMLTPLRQSEAKGRDDELSEHLASYLASDAVATRTNDDLTLVLASCLRPNTLIVPEPDLPEPADATSDARSG